MDPFDMSHFLQPGEETYESFMNGGFMTMGLPETAKLMMIGFWPWTHYSLRPDGHGWFGDIQTGPDDYTYFLRPDLATWLDTHAKGRYWIEPQGYEGGADKTWLRRIFFKDRATAEACRHLWTQPRLENDPRVIRNRTITPADLEALAERG